VTWAGHAPVLRKHPRTGATAIGAVAGIALLLGCSPPAPFDPEQAVLSGGISLTSRLPPQSDALVLIYRPSDCFTCDQSLARFLTPPRRPTILLLTEEPTTAERHLFVMYRISVNGILARGSARPPRTPAAYLRRAERWDAVPLSEALRWLNDYVEAR
jgi:hypothetical protein